MPRPMTDSRIGSRKRWRACEIPRPAAAGLGMTRFAASETAENLRGDLERAQPRGVIVNLAGEDYFVGLRLGEELLETPGDCPGRSNGGVAGALTDGGTFRGRAKFIERIDRGRKFSGAASD